MKLKKCLILVLAISLLLTAVCMFTATAEEEVAREPAPDINLKIYAKNLSLENAIYISYAVPVAGTESADSVKLLIWMTPQSEYTYGTQTYELSPEGTTTIGSAQYYVFVFDKLAAKRMAVDIYAKVYATDGENEYYSALDKYSILQYAYNKLGKTSSTTPTAKMANLLNSMLDYGAYAQEYFGFNTDRLANDDYYQIKVENALLSDGATHGLYRPDTQLIVTAPEENANGEDFLYWQNGAGDQLSESLSYTITVGEVNETYTAVYGKKAPAATDDSYFTFTDLSSVTCSIAAKDVNNMPAEVVIPSTYNGKTVTMIAPRAFFGCSSLTSIVIPDSVTGIGDSAFYGCAALSSAPLPNTLTSIGDRAFEGCVKLANIVIPNGVTSIGEYAFLDCHSFTEITVPSSVTSLSHAVFYYCVGLTKVTLPNTITSIESFAFANCYELTDITIPSSVVSIGDSAFLSCTSLASVVIPDSVTSLGGSAFSGCEGLISVTLPNSLTQLNSGVFENCSNMTDIVIPNSIKSIYGDAFEGTALEAVYYCGTAIKWQNMTIYSWNPVILNAPRYYYSETQPTDTTDRYWHYVDGAPTIWEVPTQPQPTDDSYFTFTELSDGTYSIAAKDINNIPAEVVIPSTYNAVAVTKIANSAFSGCKSLTSVIIPDSVTNISHEAFKNCSRLTSIMVSGSVTTFGVSSFYGCTGIEKVYYTGTVENWCQISFLPNSNPMRYGKELYFNNVLVTELEIPATITKISTNTFYGCSGLTSIIIPNSVTQIGSCAFQGCTGLTSITIPDSVTSIGGSAFAGCSGLTSINIPNSVTNIDSSILTGCDNLETITSSSSAYPAINNCLIKASTKTLIAGCQNSIIPTDGSVTKIDSCVFCNNDNLTDINIPNGVTDIGGCAFQNCTGLVNITISNSVTKIGSSAFEGCTSLAKVYYTGTAEEWSNNIAIDYSNESLTSANIYYYSETRPTDATNHYWHYQDGVPTTWKPYVAPTDDSYFTFTELDDGTYGIKVTDTNNMPAEVVIPATYNGKAVTAIENNMFKSCTNLTSITIPDSVTSIGDYAFFGCTNLANITISNSVTSIGYSAFYNCTNLVSVTIPDSVTEIGWNAFRGCTSLVNVTLPSGLTSIGEWVFGECISLTDITIPDSVRSIGYGAFNGCKNLVSITIPNSVTNIDDYVFAFCTNLSNVSLSNSCSIGNYMFYHCTGLVSITIPEGVTNIGEFAFEGCSSLNSVVIPSSMTNIGERAFDNCDNLSTDILLGKVGAVYYAGTKEKWGNISIGSGNERLTYYADRYYYSKTQPTTSGNYWHYVDGVPTAWE